MEGREEKGKKREQGSREREGRDRREREGRDGKEGEREGMGRRKEERWEGGRELKEEQIVVKCV